TGRPNALDLDSLLEIARNDVPFGRIVRAITVGSDAGVSGAGPDHDATVAGVDRYGGGAGGVQADEIAGDMSVVGADAVNQDASSQVARDDIARARRSPTDNVVLRRGNDHDAIGGIAEGGRARGISADVIALDDVSRCGGAMHLNSCDAI